MNTRLLTGLLTAVLFPGCLSTDGFKKASWSKTELVHWYSKTLPVASGLSKFGYKGSDNQYHYFITRPYDSFLGIRMARSELTLPDERRRSDLGWGSNYFYLVDPSADFRKIPEPLPPW